MTYYTDKQTRNAAFRYRKAGLSVVPIGIGGDKRPYGALLPGGKWKQFQDQRPTAAETKAMFPGDRNMGVGIIAGPVSGPDPLVASSGE